MKPAARNPRPPGEVRPPVLPPRPPETYGQSPATDVVACLLAARDMVAAARRFLESRKHP